jgi:hypothetical protein
MGNKKDRSKAVEKKAAAAHRAGDVLGHQGADSGSSASSGNDAWKDAEGQHRRFKMWSPQWLPFCLCLCFITCIHTFNILRVRYGLGPSWAFVLSVTLVSAGALATGAGRGAVEFVTWLNKGKRKS